eukprot:2279287-Alexandrium_andersonii.AAC.1
MELSVAREVQVRSVELTVSSMVRPVGWGGVAAVLKRVGGRPIAARPLLVGPLGRGRRGTKAIGDQQRAWSSMRTASADF